MARQTRTLFLCNYSLFIDSNYEAPHYALSPNYAYVLRFMSTYSPEYPQLVFPGYAFSERRVSTREPGVTFRRTNNSSSAFYSASCYSYLDYNFSIVRAHMTRSLIAISAIVKKRLNISEKIPFCSNH
jgi:hypothetical protein